MEKLAILGGTPVRTERLSYGHQWIDEEDVKAVSETLVSPYLTCGPKVKELEERLCRITTAKYCAAVSNGTAALHTACMAIGIKPGDEVIVSSITFAASSNCVLYCGGTPVFADIRPDTYNLDPDDVERKITPRTKAVIAVDFTGQAVELDRILKICREHNLYLIEDAAHSIGTKYNGRPIGSIADITTFSFHPVKTVTAGEGGACLTNDEKLYKRLKLFSSHGITHDLDEMVNANDAGYYNEQILLGYNYRITEFQASLLLSQLNKLDKFSNMRKALRARYDEAFKDMPEIILQEVIPESDTTWHLYVIRLNREHLSCDRRKFYDALCAEGITSQVHYIPVYRHSYYEGLGYKKGLCPNAEAFYEDVLSIPFYPALTEEEIEDTIKVVKKVAAWYSK